VEGYKKHRKRFSFKYKSTNKLSQGECKLYNSIVVEIAPKYRAATNVEKIQNP
jgi:hypothetical protein